MRRPAVLLIAIAAALAAPVSAIAQTLTVPIDQSAKLVLPRGAKDVMIGNPAIADVTVVDPRNAILIGRGYGVTNLVVMNGAGRVLMDSQVVVSSPDAGRITVARGGVAGARVENYTCAPRCERTPMPGEADTFYNAYAAAYQGYAARSLEARNNGAAKTGP